MPFLEYITHKDHELQVCIGVPYLTSVWQVANSKKQNGSYKITLARSKKELRLFIDPPSLTSNDVIPLVNEALKASFDRVDKNKKAIAEHGWGLCNIDLLLYKEIQNTMTTNDCIAFKLPKSNFVTPIQNGSFQPPLTQFLFHSHNQQISAI